MGAAGAACYQSEHLSSTSQRSVVLMPATSYAFGMVPVGSGVQTVPDPYFTIRAQSETDDDYVDSIVLAPGCGSDFSLDLTNPLPGQGAEVYCMGGTTYGGALVPGGSASLCTYVDYLFGAKFQPSSPGAQSCRVDITTTPKVGGVTTLQSVFLSGSGVAATYSMGVNPTMIDFGDVPLSSTSAPQTVTVKNTGGAMFDFQGSNFDPTHFAVSPSVMGPYTLAPNGSKPFSVSCQTGTNPGTYSGSLWFYTFSTQGNLAQQVMLNCRGIATSVSETPNPVNLGMHLLGDSPTTVLVTITNTSGTMVTLGNFTLNGTPGSEVTYPSNPGTFSLFAGSAAIVNVEYAPTSERDVGSLGTMTFDVNGTPNNVPLIGGAHTGSIGTNPASLDFGAVCAGSTASLDLTVFANGGGDVQLQSSLGNPGAPFSATLAGGATLMAHHANEVTIATTAKPMTGETPGDKTDTVTLHTNIPGMSSIPIDMHAVVLAGGVAPTPNLVHFGPNALAKPSPAQMITLTNCGSGDLMLTDASFTGSNGGEFTIVSPADPHVTIAKTESAQFLVVMTPSSAGTKTAQLVFSYAGGTAVVDLDGTGIGTGGGGSTTDRETYYACAIGAPSGLIPLGLVVFALRRRRRR
jgi:hypothetical protein